MWPWFARRPKRLRTPCASACGRAEHRPAGLLPAREPLPASLAAIATSVGAAASLAPCVATAAAASFAASPLPLAPRRLWLRASSLPPQPPRRHRHLRWRRGSPRLWVPQAPTYDPTSRPLAKKQHRSPSPSRATRSHPRLVLKPDESRSVEELCTALQRAQWACLLSSAPRQAARLLRATNGINLRRFTHPIDDRAICPSTALRLLGDFRLNAEPRCVCEPFEAARLKPYAARSPQRATRAIVTAKLSVHRGRVRASTHACAFRCSVGLVSAREPLPGGPCACPWAPTLCGLRLLLSHDELCVQSRVRVVACVSSHARCPCAASHVRRCVCIVVCTARVVAASSGILRLQLSHSTLLRAPAIEPFRALCLLVSPSTLCWHHTPAIKRSMGIASAIEPLNAKTPTRPTLVAFASIGMVWVDQRSPAASAIGSEWPLRLPPSRTL